MSLAIFRKNKYLIVILVIAIVARMIWLNATILSDEGQLGYDAMLWLRGQMPYLAGLSEKPPLSYLTYAASVSVFGNTIVPVRLFNDALFFISIVPFYLLVRNWYGKKVGLVASFLYVFMLNAPAFWGQFADAIPLSMPFTIFSVFTCDKYVQTDRIRFLLASGAFLSIAGLIRLNSFAILILLLAILVLNKRKSLIEPSKRFLNRLTGNIFVLMISVLLPVLLVIFYFWTVGALGNVLYNTLFRTVGEVGPALATLNPPFGWQFLGIAEGLPIMIFSILGLLTCAVIRRRPNIYVITWLLIPLPVFIALEPHDSYHFLEFVPAASILSALALSVALQRVSETQSTNPLIRLSKLDLHSIFVVIIFGLLLLTSTYFQALQFPSGNVHWEFIDYPYSSVGTYNQINQLSNYLKSLNATDGEVLIQDWTPYVYWLAGIKAPSSFLNTVDVPLGIPQNEYDMLLAEVKDGKIPYVIVDSDRGVGSDQITDFVRANYFPINSIGSVDIYSASYPMGVGVSYSFIASLNSADAYGVLPNGMSESLHEIGGIVVPIIERLTVNNITQFAIRQHPLDNRSVITYSNVQIGSNSTLEFNIAIDPQCWNGSGDGVDFKIIIENNAQSETIFSQYIDPKHNLTDRRWFYNSIPLEAYSNKTVSISLVTDPGPTGDSNWDWACWGNPIIIQGK